MLVHHVDDSNSTALLSRSPPILVFLMCACHDPLGDLSSLWWNSILAVRMKDTKPEKETDGCGGNSISLTPCPLSFFLEKRGCQF